MSCAIGVEHDPVAPERDTAEDASFIRVGIAQKRERSIRMAREQDRVETLRLLAGRLHVDAARPARDGLDRRPQTQLRAHVGNHPRDVVARPALDGPPVMLPGEGEQAVIGKKPGKNAGRKVQHFGAGGGPDRAAHRQQIIALEPGAEAPPANEFAQREVGIPGGVGQRSAVEDRDIAEHAPETGLHRIGRLGQRSLNIAAAIFQLSAIDGYRERHVAATGRYVEPLEKPAQVRVVDAIEDDEAGVHRDIPSAGLHGDRSGMAARAIRCLEQDDLVSTRQQPCGAEAGNARHRSRRPSADGRHAALDRPHARVSSSGLRSKRAGGSLPRDKSDPKWRRSRIIRHDTRRQGHPVSSPPPPDSVGRCALPP